jgi:hypothetical protein
VGEDGDRPRPRIIRKLRPTVLDEDTIREAFDRRELLYGDV